MFPMLFLQQKIEGIFTKYYNEKAILVHSSGSSRQEINGTLVYTKPEYTIYPFDKKYDWCSNSDKKPQWISFSIRNHFIKLNGYFLRAGCCYHNCCINNEIENGCCLYSWSLQISNDNISWKEIHKVNKDYEMKFCNEKSYKLDKTYTARYIRIIQNEPCVKDSNCMSINRFEILGDLEKDTEFPDKFDESFEDEEDISVIGHLSKNNVI